MKLFYSPASPYVRKVMVVAHEKGLADKLERIVTTVSPVQRNESLMRHNPLGKVPCLVLPDGRSLFDSSVIAAYFDSLSAPHLSPDDGPARYDALMLEALADGLLDACLLLRYETLARPSEKFWQEWHDGQMAKVDGALDLLHSRWTDALNGWVTIGVVAVACALGYLDFRFADKDWRRGRSDLADYFKRFGERPSMQATRPAG